MDHALKQRHDIDIGKAKHESILTNAPNIDDPVNQAYLNVQVGKLRQARMQQYPFSLPQAPYGTQSQSTQDLQAIDQTVPRIRGDQLVRQQIILQDSQHSSSSGLAQEVIGPLRGPSLHQHKDAEAESYK